MSSKLDRIKLRILFINVYVKFVWNLLIYWIYAVFLKYLELFSLYKLLIEVFFNFEKNLVFNFM